MDSLHTAITTITIRDLIQKVQDGEIRGVYPPWNWGIIDIQRLIDSIWRGYPIGSLVVHEQSADQGMVKIGDVTLDVPAVPYALWVVDGQRRIASIAATLLDLNPNDIRWTLWFNPESEQFLSGPIHPNRKCYYVPLWILGDLRRLGRYLRDANFSEPIKDRIEKAQQCILDYTIPMYILKTEDELLISSIRNRISGREF